MADIDIITGFLGAGKTTFIRKYAQFLQEKGESFAVIENEYGTKGIDSKILAADKIHTDELFGGCICCTLKVGFHDMLLELSKHFDRVIVEPSGVYDISQFYSVMASPELKGKCNIGNVICIVDPFSLETLDDFSRDMLKNQVMASGVVLFSMNDTATENEIIEYRQKLSDVLDIKDFNVLSYNSFDKIICSGGSSYIPYAEQTHSAKYLSTDVKIDDCEINEMNRRIKAVFNSQKCGNVLRIKGIWGGFIVNCTKSNTEIYPEKGTNGLNIIGLDISRKEIKKILSGEEL